MPTTDPTFQHSDEDWTQITQPRLRKRVQNRVSQRKHRNKVRQQRANSTDAEQVLSAPNDPTNYWPPYSSLASDGMSHDCLEEHHLQNYVPSQQQLLHPTISPDYGGFEAFDCTNFGASNLGSTHTPWVGNPASTYPQPSSYSISSSLDVPSDYPHDPDVYGSPTALYSKRPSLSSLVTSSSYKTGTNVVDTSRTELPQQWHQMGSTTSPSPYCTNAYSAGPYPVPPSYHTSYTSWQPQRTSETPFDHTVGDPPVHASKRPSPDRKAQNLARTATKDYSTANGRATVVSASSIGPHVVHASHEASKPLYVDSKSRDLSIDPTYYKHSKSNRALSISQQPKKSRR
ncbi:MAG: hypothetical protein Q9197_006781 [Variospora fuerteventurae]